MSLSVLRPSSSQPTVAAVGPLSGAAQRAAEALDAFRESSQAFVSLERGLRAGLRGEALLGEAQYSFATVRALAFYGELGIPYARIEELLGLDEGERMGDFVGGVIGTTLAIHRRALALLPPDDPLVPEVEARVGFLEAVPRRELSRSFPPQPPPRRTTVPTWARRFLLVGDSGRSHQVRLDDDGEVSLGPVFRRLAGWLPRPSLWGLRAKIVFQPDGAYWFDFDRGKGFLINDLPVEEGLGLEINEGDILEMGPVRVSFHLRPEAPRLERFRGRFGSAQLPSTLLELVGRADPTARDAVERFFQGTGRFDQISSEGGLAEAVDRVLRRLERIVLAQLVGDPSALETSVPRPLGEYLVSPVELRQRVGEMVSEFLPGELSERDQIAVMEGLVEEVRASSSPGDLAGRFRESLMLGADLVADTIERRFQGRRPVSLSGIPSAFGAAAKVRGFALLEGRTVVEPTRRFMSDPLAVDEGSAITSVGLSDADFFAAPWRRQEVPPALESQLAGLAPLGGRPVDLAFLGRLEQALEGEVAARREVPVGAFSDLLIVSDGALEVRASESAGSIGLPGPGDRWWRGFLKALEKERLSPLATGGMIVFGAAPRSRAEFDGNIFLTFLERTMAEGLIALYREVYGPAQSVTDAPIQITAPIGRAGRRQPGSVVVHVGASRDRGVTERLLEFHRRHGRLFGAGLPRFAEPVVGRDGQPLKGIGFGQRPYLGSVGFSALRSGSLRKAIRVARILVGRGEEVPWGEMEQLGAFFLRHSGVALHRPAFSDDAAPGRFEFLRLALDPKDPVR